MPWWFWVLLWTALLVGGAVALVLVGYWLVRKALRALRDVGESLAGVTMGSALALSEPTDDGGDPAQAANAPAPGSAVFADPETVRRAYRRGKSERREARRLRRVARRAARGQAQSLRDLGLI
ncbi:hypothetical protein [Sinomonas sp. P47F7]|uniref:hypothetical protein n=1 Tax=Sinomonas sp. P47F7 TaxID=3410987 RepID=UPI003BF47E20